MDVGIVDQRFASGGIAFNVGNMDTTCQSCPRRLKKLDLPESTLLKEEKLRMKLHKAQCRRMFKDAERAHKIEERKKLRASALIKKEENMKAKAEVNDKVWGKHYDAERRLMYKEAERMAKLEAKKDARESILKRKAANWRMSCS